ncbi:MAG: hypothetical protein JSU00_12925 [Acidobacteria bacterium]|nr:hypothetical protein [Acidobacteriota bacterium]
MNLTRRAVLAAAGAAIASGRPQITSRSGLRMEQHGDPTRPAIAVFLPSQSAPAAVIEMPEHAWRRVRENDSQAWFYKMYGPDSKEIKVTWASTPDTLSFRMEAAAGFTLNGGARLTGDRIAIQYEILSASEPRLAAVQAVTCVRLYRPFTDVFLERTFVHDELGLQPIAVATPERLAENAEEWLPCRYISNVGGRATPYKVEKLDGVTRYFRPRPADAPFIATASDPAGWTACTFSPTANSVFTNPARTCHHADPISLSVQDGRASHGVTMLILRGSVADAWKRVSSELRDKD